MFLSLSVHKDREVIEIIVRIKKGTTNFCLTCWKLKGFLCSSLCPVLIETLE